MNEVQIREFLHAAGVSAAEDQNRTGLIVSRCPLGHITHSTGNSVKFAITINPGGQSRARCLVCNLQGTLEHVVHQLIIHKVGDFHRLAELLEKETDDVDLIELFQQKAEPPIKEVIPWPEEFLKRFSNIAPALPYLKNRGFSAEDAQLCGLLYDPEMHRIIFPIRDKEGRLTGVQSRTIMGEKPPYLQYKYHPSGYPFHQDGIINPQVWIGEHEIDWAKPLLLTEGPMDWMRCKSVYSNSLCALSASFGVAKVSRIYDAWNIVTLFDLGHGGDTARSNLDKLRPEAAMTHLKPKKPAKDAADMHPKAIRALLKPHLMLD